MSQTFGSFLREMREDAGYGLREFAVLIGEKPSNLSAIETGSRKPWPSPERLRLVAQCLSMEEHSAEWETLFDLARRHDRLPADVEHLCSRSLVPSLLRTIDQQQLSDEQIQGIIDLISKQKGIRT